MTCRSFRVALFLPLLLVCGVARAEVLRDSVRVEDAVVRLGDVLIDAAAAADIPVAAAPLPGESTTLPYSDVAKAVRAAGFDLEIPTRGYVTVERIGRPVSTALLEDRIRASLAEQGIEGPLGVRITGQRGALHVPVKTDPTRLDIEALHYDERSGRFSATAVLPAGPQAESRTEISGVAEAQQYVPVLARPMQPGEIIAESDLDWKLLSARRVNRTHITDAAALVGMEPRRSLRAGTPLRHGEVQRPLLVKKGSFVTLFVRNGAMLLTATGRAMQDGARDDLVRIQNIDTGRTLEGRVEGPDRVRVFTPAAVAAIDR